MTATDDALRMEFERYAATSDLAMGYSPEEAQRKIASYWRSNGYLYTNINDAWQAYKAASAAQSAELARLRGMGWQPIETAPKDGTAVLGLLPWKGVVVVNFGEGGYGRSAKTWRVSWTGAVLADEICPTHWQPLPEPPTALASRNGGGG